MTEAQYMFVEVMQSNQKKNTSDWFFAPYTALHTISDLFVVVLKSVTAVTLTVKVWLLDSPIIYEKGGRPLEQVFA